MLPLTFILPNAISVYVVFALIQGKPQGYLFQWVRSKIFGQVAAYQEPETDLPEIEV